MSLFKLKILYKKSPTFLALMSLLIFVPCAKTSGKEAKDAFYSVQIASCKSFSEAKAIIDSLRPQNLGLFCKSVNFLKRGKWYRVLAGRYESKEEALDAGESLKKRGIIKSFVLRKVKSSPIHPEDIGISSSQKVNSLNVDKKILAKKISSTDKIPLQRSVRYKKPSSGEVNPLNSKKQTMSSKKVPMTNQRHPQVSDKQASLYDAIIRNFNLKRYRESLNELEQMIRRKDFKAPKKETISRLLADCYYFLGRKSDDKRYFLKAIDQYRELIRDYPNLKKKDASIIIYRLAKSYEHLNFYPEALAEFKYFYSNYPKSKHFPESLFMMGKVYYKMGKFNKAIDKFKEYIEKFPDDNYVKDAYFDVGDCYFQMCQFNDADIWYGNALERWPTLEKLSKDNLFDLGSFYLQTKRYNQALKAFFTFVALFPEEKYSKNVIYSIGRSIIGVHQPFLGVKMLALVISKYPGTKEAQKSARIMADLGIINSKTKPPTYILSGMDCYQAMIKTCENMIAQVPDNEEREELLFLKGYALLQKGCYRESFNIYYYLLNKFVYEIYKEASEKNIILSLKYLVNNYYLKQEYFSIYNLYRKSYKYGLFKYGDFDMLLKIGDSLNKLGLEDYAIKYFTKMANIFNGDSERDRILFNIAQSNYNRGHFNDAENELKDLLKKKSTTDKKIFIKVKELLGNIYYRQGSFEKAAHFYSEILEPSKPIENIADIYADYADSLMQMNLYPSASINYRKAIEICKDKDQKCPISLITHSYEGLGNCLYKEAKYKAAISMYKNSLNMTPKGKEKPWIIFNMGRAYTKLDNNSMAEKIFNILKEKSQDNFWPNLVDCYMHDKIWTRKYSKYLVEFNGK